MTILLPENCSFLYEQSYIHGQQPKASQSSADGRRIFQVSKYFPNQQEFYGTSSHCMSHSTHWQLALPQCKTQWLCFRGLHTNIFFGFMLPGFSFRNDHWLRLAPKSDEYWQAFCWNFEFIMIYESGGDLCCYRVRHQHSTKCYSAAI